jgi:phosphomannomutase
MLAILTDAQRKNVTLSGLQAALPPRYTFSDRLKDFPTAESQALLARFQEGNEAEVLARATQMFGGLAGPASAFDKTDGLRITFEGGDIIHLRPSGNAPELRCYTESATLDRAATLNKRVLETVNR